MGEPFLELRAIGKTYPGVTALHGVSLAVAHGEVVGLIGENGAVDMQPCGGTHVGRTGEIGAVAVTKIEKKGKLNRRIRVAFA